MELKQLAEVGEGLKEQIKQLSQYKAQAESFADEKKALYEKFNQIQTQFQLMKERFNEKEKMNSDLKAQLFGEIQKRKELETAIQQIQLGAA